MTIELALDLAEFGFKVFPVNHTEDNEKKPHTSHGHLDATQDPNIIMEWWTKWPNAKVGVPAGANNLVIADIDFKNGKDGFTSLDERWYDVPETFAYDTLTGGRHLIYRAPNDVTLNGQANYRGMEGVDRRGGESWVMWVGGVPDSEIVLAPEWLCDVAEVRSTFNFEGDLSEWFDQLVEGEPNALVRRAIEKINNDMSHSDMVEAQHSAIRLGAEGNSGIPVLLEALHEAWMNRPAENHSTPEAEWDFKFAEALQSGLEKFGALTDTLKNLPDYSIAMVPTSVPDNLVTNAGTKADFSKLLGLLVKEISDDNRILTILWNSPGTKKWARDWGLEFVAKRIQEARITPEPTRENPRVEEKREAEEKGKSLSLNLLTTEEREYLKSRPTFVDRVEKVASDMGYDQLPYFRSVAWVMAGMAFSFKGFIPLSKTHKMNLNLWFINLGESGTGKSVTGDFRDAVLKIIFSDDNPDGIPYDLGDDSSPQGLHAALLDRDRKASMFSSDEAAGFFSTLGLKDWKTGLDEKLTSWYNGWVQGSNKMTLKELRGKTAMTSFNMHMFGTPGKVTKVISSDMFETGFMARVNWVIGNPPREDDSRFQLNIDMSEESQDFDVQAKEVVELAADLISATIHIEKPVALLPAPDVMNRLSKAYKDSHQFAQDREHFDLVDPSLTRMAETMMKCAGIAALYRGSDVIEMVDALHAIRAIEEWNRNLHTVVSMISSGDFQRRAAEIESWISSQDGTVTRTRLFHQFRNFIEKDSRELDSLIVYLTESGTINKLEDGRGGVKYALNGSV